MVRPSKNEKANPNPSNPVLIERNRLKKLAFSKNILSERSAKSHTQLAPSKTVLKHHGKDIIKKSQRKNRYLFSFPGLIAPIGGGKIGELKNLGTKNPILYLDFPQGQMKLFGTIIYPKNKYLTLQFSRGGKNVMCEDYFDNMIVFTDAWWIGRRDENPEEARLEFPKELTERPDVDCDFRAGVGATVIDKPSSNKQGRKLAEESPETVVDDDLSDGEDEMTNPMEVTPVRHSERNVGKRFRYIEASSGDSVGGDEDVEEERNRQKCDSTVMGSSMDSGDEDDLELTRKVHDSSMATVKSKNSVTSTIMLEETSKENHGSLVQATISTLFKKAEKKKDPEVKKSPLAQDSRRKKSAALKKGVGHDEKPAKKRKAVGEKSTGKEKVAKGKEVEEESDPIDVSSSSSKDTDGSDEEWAA